MRKPWTEEEVSFLKENYHLLSHKEITERLGRTGAAIRMKASHLGLKKFPQDISFFEQWNSQSAYVIGFFAADGYAQVRKGKGVVISITQKDRQILDDIQELLKMGTVYYVRRYDSYRYEIYGRALYNKLCKIFGHDVRNKSRTLQWPKTLNEYARDFILGYFDGDGHIGIDKRGTPQMRFYCGSEDFRDRTMLEISERTGINGTTSLAINDVHLAIYTGVKSICLARWLYDGCELALQRKKDKAIEIASLRRRYNNASVTPKMKELFPDILARKA